MVPAEQARCILSKVYSPNIVEGEFCEVRTRFRSVASCVTVERVLLRIIMRGERDREGVQINPQTIARVFGVLFLVTFITSIPAYFFYVPVLDDSRYIVGAGADTRVSFGAFLEPILIIANIGTAVVVYPILRRQNEILALGYVTARIVECVFIAVGILSLLTVVTLRQEAAAGADAASLLTAGKSLVALHVWTRLLGPGFFVGVGNGLILGYLMYTSRLVPRGMAVLGLVG